MTVDNPSCNSKRLASPSCHVSSFNFIPHPNKRIIWDICFLSLAASSHQAKTTDRRSWQVRLVEIWSLKSWRHNNISEPFLLDLLLVCSNIKVDQLLQGPSNHIHKQLDWIIRPVLTFSHSFLFRTLILTFKMAHQYTRKRRNYLENVIFSFVEGQKNREWWKRRKTS